MQGKANHTSHGCPSQHEQKLEQHILLSDSEFIAFAMHRLWKRSNIQRRRSVSNNSAVCHRNLVCPGGTEEWYPGFVTQVHHMVTVARCSKIHILVALLYIARLRYNKLVEPGKRSELVALTAALVLASKVQFDSRYSNKCWSKISGVPLEELNRAEIEMIMQLGGLLHVTESCYSSWMNAIKLLCQEHALVLHGASVTQQEFANIECLDARPDLVKEIKQIRERRLDRSNTR